MASVEREDVQKWAREEAPVVQVEGVEQGREEDSSSVPSGKERAHSSDGEAHVHEGANIKTSYDVEEDVSPSLFQKLKGAFLGAEDKHRPKDALQAKDADPHPSLNPEGTSRFSHLQQRIWGSKDQATPNAEAVSSSKDALEEAESSRGYRPEEKGEFGSNELGTGYEEDTEKGTLSSGSSLDSTTSGLPSQSQSLFKPIKENKESDLTLEDLRASKTSHQIGNPDDVKAPGILGRAKDEVEAVTDQLTEALNLKGKRSASGDHKEVANQSGFLSRIAEKIGYGGGGGGGGLGRSQSQ